MSLALATPAGAADEPWRGALDQAVEQALTGDLQASRDSLLRLEKKYPDQPEIIRRTAQVMARSRQKTEAIERFRRLKTLSPDTLTDREELLVVLLSDGQSEEYAKERKELLAAFKAAGDRKVARSAMFIREYFVVNKTINVDSYEYYPGTRSGPVTPYYLFVVKGSDGAEKGHFVVAENSAKTAELKAKGELPEGDGGYYLEFRQPLDPTNAEDPVLLARFPGARPPGYARARDAVVAYISASIKS